MKKKTATVTFHASHNYGSMLQAYALQQTLLSLGVDNEIINLRTAVQRNMYRDPRQVTSRGVKARVKRMLNSLLSPELNAQLDAKYGMFEDFMTRNMRLTAEVDDVHGAPLPAYDYYITGSDQCWNLKCHDFDWAYYLDFTDSPNKIAYASSMGPSPSDDSYDRIRREVSRFKAISVREQGTCDIISSMTSLKPEVVIDPTMLLGRDEWLRIAGSEPIVKGRYIFMYTPHDKPDVVEIAVAMSRRLGIPVLTSSLTSYRKDLMLSRSGAIFKMDVGPAEFLNLILNATVVVSGSFHALVFSTIFHTPFWAVNGDKDSRMRQILSRYGLTDRYITRADCGAKATVGAPDFSRADEALASQRADAVSFIRRALDLGDTSPK